MPDCQAEQNAFLYAFGQWQQRIGAVNLADQQIVSFDAQIAMLQLQRQAAINVRDQQLIPERDAAEQVKIQAQAAWEACIQGT